MSTRFIEGDTHISTFRRSKKASFSLFFKYLRYYRNPCKKCLVQACCDTGSVDCENLMNHSKFISFVLLPIRRLMNKLLLNLIALILFGASAFLLFMTALMIISIVN